MGWEKVACWGTKATILSLKRVKIEEKLLWRAYRKSPTLLRTVPFPTPCGLLFSRIGVHNPTPKLQSRVSCRVLFVQTSFLFRSVDSSFQPCPCLLERKARTATGDSIMPIAVTLRSAKNCRVRSSEHKSWSLIFTQNVVDHGAARCPSMTLHCCQSAGWYNRQSLNEYQLNTVIAACRPYNSGWLYWLMPGLLDTGTGLYCVWRCLILSLNSATVYPVQHIGVARGGLGRQREWKKFAQPF